MKPQQRHPDGPTLLDLIDEVLLTCMSEDLKKRVNRLLMIGKTRDQIRATFRAMCPRDSMLPLALDAYFDALDKAGIELKKKLGH
jgi:hypothetical protein